MEENNDNFELDNAEQIEEETPLTKEEILERFRRENDRAGDEREQKLLSRGVVAMCVAGAIVLMIIYCVNLLYLERNCYEFMSLIFVMNGVNFIWQGKFGKKMKKAFLVIGIATLILGICLLIGWIVTLAV